MTNQPDPTGGRKPNPDCPVYGGTESICYGCPTCDPGQKWALVERPDDWWFTGLAGVKDWLVDQIQLSRTAQTMWEERAATADDEEEVECLFQIGRESAREELLVDLSLRIKQHHDVEPDDEPEPDTQHITQPDLPLQPGGHVGTADYIDGWTTALEGSPPDSAEPGYIDGHQDALTCLTHGRRLTGTDVIYTPGNWNTGTHNGVRTPYGWYNIPGPEPRLADNVELVNTNLLECDLCEYELPGEWREYRNPRPDEDGGGWIHGVAHIVDHVTIVWAALWDEYGGDREAEWVFQVFHPDCPAYENPTPTAPDTGGGFDPPGMFQ